MVGQWEVRERAGGEKHGAAAAIDMQWIRRHGAESGWSSEVSITKGSVWLVAGSAGREGQGKRGWVIGRHRQGTNTVHCAGAEQMLGRPRL